MKSGTKPTRQDHRTYSWHRTFGAIQANDIVDFNLDIGLTNPDQIALGLPEACTGFTQSEICQDEDKQLYDPRYTYDQTLLIEGIGPNDPTFEKVGCDIQDSLKSTIVYGVKGNDDKDPYTHHRGAYYDVLDNNQGLDAFDAAISAMRSSQIPLSAGLQWLKEWSNAPQGLITSVYIPDTNAPWHNMKVCGVKTIGNEQFLIAKPWIGSTYGDNGFAYFPRDVWNKAMANRHFNWGTLSWIGACAFTLAPYTGQIQNVKMTFIEVIISRISLLIAKLKSMTSPIVTPPANPQPTEDKLTRFCEAIRDHEGYYPGSRSYRNNNPGNVRYSSVGYKAIYEPVDKDVDNFAIFKDYATGFLYLKNLILGKAQALPNDTIGDFVNRYAPASDGNNVIAYTAFLQKQNPEIIHMSDLLV